jgi:hypothetical protein
MCRRDGTDGRFGGGGRRGWVSFLTFVGLRGDFVGGVGSGHFVFGSEWVRARGGGFWGESELERRVQWESFTT